MAHQHAKRLGNLKSALWWLGWHPVAALIVGALAGLVVSNAVAVPVGLLFGINPLVTMATGTVGGVAAGSIAWHRGTVTVNRDYTDVVEAVRAGVRNADSETFVLFGEGTGTRPLIDPLRRYETTVLRLDADAMSIYHGTFDLVGRRPSFDRDAVAIPYDRVDTVDYEGAHLRVETTPGDRFSYAATSAPSELRRAIRNRIEN